MWAATAAVETDNLLNRLDTILLVARLVEQGVGGAFWVEANPTVWACSILVEGPLDLNPGSLEKVTESGLFLAWVDGVEALLADYLADEFGGVTHDLVTQNYLRATRPNV
jgi:hypothetical protein